MESFSQANGCHPDSHSIQYQIREQKEQSNAKEDVDGNQRNRSAENENNVIGTMQTIQICSINKKSNVDQNSISRNVQMAHWFNQNSCISRNIEMTDWFSQESESSNLLLYTWPKPHSPSAINKPSNCSSDCTKLKQKLLDMRNKESALLDRYLNLEILYGEKCKELARQKQEEFKHRGISEAKIQALMSAKEFLLVERHKLISRLLAADRLVSNIRRENSILRERLKTIAPQKSRNEENQSTQAQQLQSNQTDLKAMTQRAAELEEFCSHLLMQRDHLMKDFEFQHEKKVLHLKKEIDELQRSLNSKIQESEQLQNRLAKFEPNCEEIPNEKRNDSEIRKLVLQLRHLEEEKSQLKQWNSILNGELKILEDKVRAREELPKYRLTSNFDRKYEANQHSNEKLARDASLQSVPDLSKVLQIYETQNGELKSHLEHLSKEFPYWQETTKPYASRFSESKENADITKIKRDHEIELAGIKNQYESKILDLEKEIENLKANLSQIEEEKNKFKVLNNVLLDQREAWNQEQTEYQKTKLKLLEKIKAAEELEGKLQEKINKYESHLAVMEREHQEEISKLQMQIFELTKSGSQKENKTAELVPTERSLKTQNILMKCLKQTEQIKVLEYNSENMERSSRNPDLDIMTQGLKIPVYIRR